MAQPATKPPTQCNRFGGCAMAAATGWAVSANYTYIQPACRHQHTWTRPEASRTDPSWSARYPPWCFAHAWRCRSVQLQPGRNQQLSASAATGAAAVVLQLCPPLSRGLSDETTRTHKQSQASSMDNSAWGCIERAAPSGIHGLAAQTLTFPRMTAQLKWSNLRKVANTTRSRACDTQSISSTCCRSTA